jgi:hypothetical protein
MTLPILRVGQPSNRPVSVALSIQSHDFADFTSVRQPSNRLVLAALGIQSHDFADFTSVRLTSACLDVTKPHSY